MPIVNLGLQSFYTSARLNPQARNHRSLARYVAKSLRRCDGILEERGLLFEAGAADELARSFELFSEGDGSTDDFSTLWEELENWATTSISVNDRSDVVCKTPVLDASFAF